MLHRALKLLACFAAIAAITFIGRRIIPINATTAGFAYLVLILIIASTWGFREALLSSLVATAVLNFFFIPPVGTFTIEDPQNSVAFVSFLAASLIASRLSTEARRRTEDALERQRDLERLYTFSRSLLLGEGSEPFPKQLVRNLAQTFGFSAVVLHDRRTGEFFRAGPSDFEGLDDQLREAALQGVSYSDPTKDRTITAVRLGSGPIASLALQGMRMPDSVLQGVANLVAIGLERAKAQDLAHQIEAARRSEQLRTTIIDAMAHEFKTPLTLIKGATSSLLSGPETLSENAKEQLTIADEEADHLKDLLDNTIEMARLDTQHIDVNLELSDLNAIIREVVASMRTQLDDRPLNITEDETAKPIPLDRRLIRLAFKQLLDNALKYSSPDSAVAILLHAGASAYNVDVIDHGPGISTEEQPRVFERFFRGRFHHQIPGSGLGLNIARSIMLAHHGELTVSSRPGETTFRMTFPAGGVTS